MKSQGFVAREGELARLDGFLQRALAGQGQVCFVMGEAGSGKTVLSQEFTRRVQEQHTDLIVAVGQSDAQTGLGDAYLPFREMLGQLTGDVDADLGRGAITQENAGRLRGMLRLSGQALVEVGPDLIGIFVPGAGLAMRVGGFLAEKAGWLEKLEKLTLQQAREQGAESGIQQRHIFEQYTNVLNKLAQKQPLILVLDDLQWADKASIALLFRLGRRIGNSRILIIGTYRPDEVALGRDGDRHPLDKVQSEFARYFGDICIDLGEAQKAGGKQFVDAFVDTEPNLLGTAFRRSLFHHTGGHPLFTIELLRNMQERGDLVRDEQGRWVEGAHLDWELLPARVEGVIKERINRLEEDLRRVLRVGSVEGEDFTAEVVARVRDSDARALIRQLSGALEKKHRLVQAYGLRRLGGQRLSLYRFRHNLFQTYLYGELDEVERALLHEDVGLVLEDLYGEKVEEIAVQLAHHFVQAGIPEKARVYLGMAGQQAASRYANEEALDFYCRALHLTSNNNLEERYHLLRARCEIYDLLGKREGQEKDLDTLDKIADSLNDNRKRAELALSRGKFAGKIGDYPTALITAQKAVKLAQQIKDKSKEATGHDLWGKALRCQGMFEEAQIQLEIAQTLSKQSGARRIEASSLNSQAIIKVSTGNFQDAIKLFKEAHHIFREIGDRKLEIIALSNLAAATREGGNFTEAEPYYEDALRIAREIGEVFGQSAVLNNLGNHHEELGDLFKAKSYQEQALQFQQNIKDINGEAQSFANLGRIYTKLGKFDKSRNFFEQSLKLFHQIEDRLGESFSLAFLSLLHDHMGEVHSALELSQAALNIAQEIGSQNALPYPLTFLGHAFAALNRYSEAEDAYQKAMALRREFGQSRLAMEPLAGLAGIFLAKQDLTRAQKSVEEIMSFLQDNSLDGCEEPMRVYLNCYRVLKTTEDPRAKQILRTAFEKLQLQAGKIREDDLRNSFLMTVPAHRKIQREWMLYTQPDV